MSDVVRLPEPTRELPTAIAIRRSLDTPTQWGAAIDRPPGAALCLPPIVALEPDPRD